MPTLSYSEITEAFIAAQPTLERVVFRRVDCRDTAQNIAQDLFFKLAHLADRFSSHDDARRFLIRMAINAATDHHRVESRRADLLRYALQADELSGGHDPAVGHGISDEVEDAMAGLPERCREVIYLSRVDGLTHTEIATKLGVSRSSVEKYIARALMHCRSRLGVK